MTPIEEIPFADVGPIRTDEDSTRPPRRSTWNWDPLLSFLAFDLCLFHAWLLWYSLGGWSGITNGWPIWRDDHPLYLHSALVTRDFLDQSGTTAGYDPGFMSGYAKSVVFPSSSTLPEVVLYLVRKYDPTTVYKLYVLIGSSLAPLLVLLAARVWRLNPRATLVAVLAYLVHCWGDFPLSYVGFGMVPYFLAIPVALLTTGTVARFLDRGGFGWWFVSVLLSAATLLTHLTTAMLVIPAIGLVYLICLMRKGDTGKIPLSRHLGLWLLPVLTLLMNAFWWMPGIWLSATKGASDFAFSHSSEGLMKRVKQILVQESPTQVTLIALGVPGLILLVKKSRALGFALGGFTLAGLFWGYLAAEFPSLDFLQPGRHTYAMYSALAIATGLAFDEILTRLRAARTSSVRLDLAVLAGMVLISVRIFVPLLDVTAVSKVLGHTVLKQEPNTPRQPSFLTSMPVTPLIWTVDRIRENLKPGERLLYEEGGFSYDYKGVKIETPFGAGRFSGLLPESTRIELIGGPYLHASLQTNFTQFGEGRLFTKSDWNFDDFVKYARIYRPKAIFCWSPQARAFCLGHPELIRVVGDSGGMLFGIIKGFEGDTISGTAEVEASPGRLVVKNMKAGVDGLVVLRYHSVPYLRATPPCPLEEVRQGDDPVPFIGLRPKDEGPVTIEMELPYALRKSP